MKNSNSLVMLDLGSKHIRGGVFSLDKDSFGTLQYLGEYQSEGFLHGEITHIDKATQSLKTVVNDLKAKAGFKKIPQLWIGLTGAHFQSMNIVEKEQLVNNKPITRRIINKISSRISKKVPANHYLVHKELRLAILDGEEREQLEGLIGSNLVLHYTLIYTTLNVINNLRRIFKDACRATPERFFFNGHLASLSFEHPLDEVHGFMVIHIGASACDYMVFIKGKPYIAGSTNLGWNRLIRDIAIRFKITFEQAEYIMKSEGSTIESLDVRDIPLESCTLFGDRMELTQNALIQTMSSAVEEIFHSIRKKIRTDICRGHLSGGVFLTGGGAVTHGLEYSVQKVFNVPARIVNPQILMSEEHFPSTWAPLLGMVVLAIKEQSPVLSPQNITDYMKQSGGKIWSQMFPHPDNPDEPEGEIKEPGQAESSSSMGN